MRVTLAQAAEEFEQDLISSRKAASYVRDQTLFVARFVRSCNEIVRERSGGRKKECLVYELDPSYLSVFFAALGGGEGHYNNVLKAIRAFLRYLEHMRYIAAGEAQRLLGRRKTLKVVVKPKYYIPGERFKEMLDAAEQWHPTERITLALAFYTLGRQSEIAPITLGKVSMLDREIQIYRQKRKRWTTVAMTPELYAELARWLAWYAHETGYDAAGFMVDDHPEWQLVPRRKYVKSFGYHGRFSDEPSRFEINPELAPTHLEVTVKRALTAIGVEYGPGEGMHTVRRSGARVMFDYLVNNVGHDKALLMVSTMLDHDDPKMTLLYIGRDIERDQLNDWLKSNDMYGNLPGVQPGQVIRIPLERSQMAQDGFSLPPGIIGHG